LRARLAAVCCALIANTAGGASDDDAGAERGRALLRHYECWACHRIPGVAGATADIGPPLDDVGRRAYLAGVLPNGRANMARWIEKPQSIKPGSAMPDQGVTPADAQDMAAYLLRLR
jgi:cytochrome c